LDDQSLALQVVVVGNWGKSSDFPLPPAPAQPNSFPCTLVFIRRHTIPQNWLTSYSVRTLQTLYKLKKAYAKCVCDYLALALEKHSQALFRRFFCSGNERGPNSISPTLLVLSVAPNLQKLNPGLIWICHIRPYW
jgi:hypothetical protein